MACISSLKVGDYFTLPMGCIYRVEDIHTQAGFTEVTVTKFDSIGQEKVSRSFVSDQFVTKLTNHGG